MTDLPEVEREAMRAAWPATTEVAGLRPVAREKLTGERLWKAAREYSKQCEEELRQKLIAAIPGWGATYATSDGSDDPLRCSAEAAMAALAENGDSDER